VRIAITGADGFIARNLRLRLRELGHTDVECIGRATSAADFAAIVARADLVYHLAGVNRPQHEAEFVAGNVGLTENLCSTLRAARRRTPIVFASSIQATRDNAYGRSKLAAERTLFEHARATGAPVHVFRLANVFGKWCRPDYNSVVATFCHRITRGLPITVNDPAAALQLVYVDDVATAFIGLLDAPRGSEEVLTVNPLYATTVGEIAALLQGFAQSRASLLTPRVGTGLMRALYATYVSYLPPQSFGYRVPSYTDPRGEFVEMLKTPDCGQFSYFTAGPGITRGEHYHHSKTEKFLIVRGTARFGFRHMVTDEIHEFDVPGGAGHIVETIPGWAHNITNVGADELVVMLWANEVFDRDRPDTIAMKVRP
jgi:UDP-2-acetamido-2,6-beta-L-arabino-hexul-4-ose reductase